MKELKNLLTIDREFSFNGQIDDLREGLENFSGVNYKFLNEREIKFFSKVSWGTLIISNGVGIIDGINVRAFVSNIDANRLRMDLKTTLRPEHYFIVSLFSLFLLVTIFNDHLRWLTIYVVGLWILCHIWFQFVYRIQENKLMDKVVTKLNLSTV